MLLRQLIAIQLAALKQVEPGSVAPDFKGVTLNGDTLSLHGIKARVKLLDFWASWCEPCRRETPNVRKIYQKYHDKGLEIIGVSLDDKKQEWAKAMKNDKVTWPNVSDLKGKNSEIAAVISSGESLIPSCWMRITASWPKISGEKRWKRRLRSY